jgi:hypothetical protein
MGAVRLLYERLAAGRAEVTRLASTAMHPGTRASIARAQTDIDAAARLVRTDLERDAIARLERTLEGVERRVASIRRSLEKLGPGAGPPHSEP